MALTNIQRARIILDLLKDGTVANEAAYAQVDLAPAAVALKYAVIAAIPPGVTPTNDQLAAGLLRALRLALREALEQNRTGVASRTAYDAEVARVRAETLSEIGE